MPGKPIDPEGNSDPTMPQPPISEATTLRIRAMRETDLPALFEIYNQPAFRSGTLALPYESFEAVRQWAQARSPRDLHLVAELEDRVVGAVALRPFYGRRAHAAEFWIATHEDFTSRGVASRLMAEMIDTCDNWLNVLRIEMTVFTDNTKAIALYKKFGFEIEGTHKAATFRNGAYADAHCMARLRPEAQR